MAGGSLAPGQAGASPNPRKRKAPSPAPAAAAAAGEDGSEAAAEEIEELERELVDLDRCVLEHRRGSATRLLDAVASHLAALRPAGCLEVPTVSETSIAEDDQAKLENLKIVKSKIKANITTLPKVLEKVNASVARCEKLENLNVNIHPVLRRKW